MDGKLVVVDAFETCRKTSRGMKKVRRVATVEVVVVVPEHSSQGGSLARQ